MIIHQFYKFYYMGKSRACENDLLIKIELPVLFVFAPRLSFSSSLKNLAGIPYKIFFKKITLVM